MVDISILLLFDIHHCYSYEVRSMVPKMLVVTGHWRSQTACATKSDIVFADTYYVFSRRCGWIIFLNWFWESVLCNIFWAGVMLIWVDRLAARWIYSIPVFLWEYFGCVAGLDLLPYVQLTMTVYLTMLQSNWVYLGHFDVAVFTLV